jgi:hypothetical protein
VDEVSSFEVKWLSSHSKQAERVVLPLLPDVSLRNTVFKTKQAKIGIKLRTE